MGSVRVWHLGTFGGTVGAEWSVVVFHQFGVVDDGEENLDFAIGP